MSIIDANYLSFRLRAINDENEHEKRVVFDGVPLCHCEIEKLKNVVPVEIGLMTNVKYLIGYNIVVD